MKREGKKILRKERKENKKKIKKIENRKLEEGVKMEIEENKGGRKRK